MNSDIEKKNIHEGHRKRVRERFLQSGISSFDDYQLLEFLMFYVHKRKDTNEIGHALMDEFGSLENVFSASYDELCAVPGVGESGASLITLVGQMRNRINQKPKKGVTYLKTTEIMGEFCIDLFKDLATERLILLSLNCERKLLGVDIISDGDYSATVVDIRKILSYALKRKATMVVLLTIIPATVPTPRTVTLPLLQRWWMCLRG